jgi:ribosomal protein S27E
MKREFFSDKRREVRGGSAQMLELSCAKCGHKFFHYQKDGPGPLLRLYLDRIHAPKKFVGLQNKPLGSLKVIGCLDCGRLIAMPQMYKAEKRKAYRVFQGALKKKRIRLDSRF